MRADPDLTSVDLARESAFRLGSVEVRPSTRELIAGAAREVLEPRLMQVLVALARRRGEVVSRDELIAACWGGRIVSEDAIQRCVAGLRRQAGHAFEIETVPRVGYRLNEGAPPAGQAPSAAEPVLAVLPFDNLSGDPDMAWFSDGISEEILQTVAQRTGVKVIGRSSSFQLRGADKSTRHVAAALGASHLLDGSVRRAGDRVRIVAQLVECETQTSAWSGRFDRDLTDIFALQDEIAAAVAAALRERLQPTARTLRLAPAAYDLLLRARASKDQWLGGADVTLLQAALSIEPSLASGWALMALTQAILAETTPREEDVTGLRSQATAAAERALRLDPDAGLANVALVFTEPVCGALLEREALIGKALASSPREPLVLFHAARAAWTVGRVGEALSRAEQLREIEPLWPQGVNQYGNLLFESGRTREADSLFDEARSRWPEVRYLSLSPLWEAIYRKDWRRADDLISALEKRWPDVEATSIKRARFLRTYDAAAAEAELAQREAEVAATGETDIGIGLLCAAGFADEAFDLVERASFASLYERSGRILENRLVDRVPLFGLHSLFMEPGREMRADPRFVRLCGKLSLVDYWLSTERWADCADEVPYDFRAECRRWAAERA